MSLTQGINQRTLTIGGRMTEQLVFILRRLDLTNKNLFIYGETVESKRVKLETSRKPYGDPSPTVSVLWIHVRIPLKSASVFSVNCRSKRTKIIRKGRGLMHTKKKCSMGLIKAESLDNFGNTEKTFLIKSVNSTRKQMRQALAKKIVLGRYTLLRIRMLNHWQSYSVGM